MGKLKLKFNPIDSVTKHRKIRVLPGSQKISVNLPQRHHLTSLLFIHANILKVTLETNVSYLMKMFWKNM